jgi:ABC-type uncharacterized transport system permease subunit
MHRNDGILCNVVQYRHFACGVDRAVILDTNNYTPFSYVLREVDKNASEKVSVFVIKLGIVQYLKAFLLIDNTKILSVNLLISYPISTIC